MKTKIFLFALCLGGAACNKNNNNNGYGNPPGAPAIPGDFKQTNIVADVADYQASMLDAKLVNAWGIAINPAGIIWLSSNHAGASTIYDSTGATKLGPVAIPSHGDHFGGSPTGIVFNASADFVIPATTKSAKFIFVNEDGTISAWSGGDSTLTMADAGNNTVYKGVAIANDGNGNFLYAADFKGRKIDVYDKSWNLVTNKPFADPNIPAGFGPFNIQNIGGKLYVTYAKLQGPDNEDDQPGAGNGYINVFNPDGSLGKRFASQGALNSPWGIAQVPAGNSLPFHSIVVGNFGDGWINLYDSTGVFKGSLQSNGGPIAIPGLWALDFPVNEAPLSDPAKLYFTAGPAAESHGLFGVLKMQ